MNRKTAGRALPDLGTLRTRLSLEDGVLWWRPVEVKRPADATWNAKHAGRKVGVPKGNGYLMFRLGGRCLLVHRVVYALACGVDPVGSTVDHANGNRSDNRPENLRLATNQENVQYRSGPGANNTSGVVGVYWSKASKKWAASIKLGGRNAHLGVFTDLAVAAAVRAAAEQKHFRLKVKL